MRPKVSRIVTYSMAVRRKKPRLPKHIFGEFLYYKINWKSDFRMVIDHVIEWGDDDDWQEIVRFYGYGVVVNVVKNDLKCITKYSIPKVCKYFNLDCNDLASTRFTPFEEKDFSDSIEKEYGCFIAFPVENPRLILLQQVNIEGI